MNPNTHQLFQISTNAEATHVNMARLVPISLPGTRVHVPQGTPVCIVREVSNGLRILFVCWWKHRALPISCDCFIKSIAEPQIMGISGSNLTGYWTQYGRKKIKTLFRLYIYETRPIPRPYRWVMGRLLCVICRKGVLRLSQAHNGHPIPRGRPYGRNTILFLSWCMQYRVIRKQSN